MQPRDDAYQRREVTQALRGGSTCALCALTERSVARYLDILAYEHVNDVPMRAHLRASRGFCAQHAWQMLDQIRDPMGIGIIYRDVVNDVVKTLERHIRRFRSQPASARTDAETARGLAAQLRPRRSCVACDQARLINADNLFALARYLREDDFARAYRNSVGVCAWHARALLPRISRPDVARLVVDTLERRTAELLVHLDREASADVLAIVLSGATGARPHGAVVWDPTLADRALPADNDCWAPFEASAPAGLSPWLAHLECPVCRSLQSRHVLSEAQAGATWSSAICAEHARARSDPARVAKVVASLRGASSVATHKDSWLGLRGLSFLERAARVAGPIPASEGACPDCVAEAVESLSMIRAAFTAGRAMALADACLPHLYQSCLVPASPADRMGLLRLRTESWRELVDQLLEYIRKLDYRFRSEARGDEQLAPRLSVPQMVGQHRLG